MRNVACPGLSAVGVINVLAGNLELNPIQWFRPAFLGIYFWHIFLDVHHSWWTLSLFLVAVDSLSKCRSLLRSSCTVPPSVKGQLCGCSLDKPSDATHLVDKLHLNRRIADGFGELGELFINQHMLHSIQWVISTWYLVAVTTGGSVCVWHLNGVN